MPGVDLKKQHRHPQHVVFGDLFLKDAQVLCTQFEITELSFWLQLQLHTQCFNYRLEGFLKHHKALLKLTELKFNLPTKAAYRSILLQIVNI